MNDSGIVSFGNNKKFNAPREQYLQVDDGPMPNFNPSLSEGDHSPQDYDRNTTTQPVTYPMFEMPRRNTEIPKTTMGPEESENTQWDNRNQSFLV